LSLPFPECSFKRHLKANLLRRPLLQLPGGMDHSHRHPPRQPLIVLGALPNSIKSRDRSPRPPTSSQNLEPTNFSTQPVAPHLCGRNDATPRFSPQLLYDSLPEPGYVGPGHPNDANRDKYAWRGLLSVELMVPDDHKAPTNGARSTTRGVSSEARGLPSARTSPTFCAGLATSSSEEAFCLAG
jgi:hypothetical protein